MEGIQHETSQTCHQLGIPCLQTDANGQSPIIDVWDRQHLSERLERVHPNEAAIFMATFQLEARGLETAMQTSGEGGHYLEPRTPDGRSPDPEYRVIWLPKATKQSAILASQSTQQWNCVVRSGNRFGLRVKIEAAATVHTQHKPHTPFLDSDKILTFHAGPFPHGANRAALQKLFGQWQWAARPCQPHSRAPSGLGVIWEVQATSRPQFEFYQNPGCQRLWTYKDLPRP